jgi:hypothetical protein
MLSARDVATALAVPEPTVRDKWREWGLPAHRSASTFGGENATCTPGLTVKPHDR